MDTEVNDNVLKFKQQKLKSNYGIKVTCIELKHIFQCRYSDNRDKVGNSTVGAVLEAWDALEKQANLPEDTGTR